ncbi:TPA: hypothetical protein JLS10_004542 [Escherichia coli]|nr:hypothetical protein [Escherichia coli]HAW4229525.1 hypothetical protein [Escherichia coli]
MKKLMIASAIAMTMTAGSAMAALGDAGSQGQVQFVATIAAKTCDLVVEGDGAVNDLIQFGTHNASGAAVTKDFFMKAKDPSCLSAGKAHFKWTSPNFDAQGIKNQGGAATDTWVELKAVTNGTSVADNTNAITSVNNKVIFTFDNDAKAKGFKYSAKLTPGAQVGDFHSAAAYTVVYE